MIYGHIDWQIILTNNHLGPPNDHSRDRKMESERDKKKQDYKDRQRIASLKKEEARR